MNSCKRRRIQVFIVPFLITLTCTLSSLMLQSILLCQDIPEVLEPGMSNKGQEILDVHSSMDVRTDFNKEQTSHSFCFTICGDMLLLLLLAATSNSSGFKTHQT
ncbi:hypothetical protein E2C01_002047 [Portunus trituberculatus]|uniref:Uncharacterized protein n=1 Tax=Portunus trituberculatus TaxID=210409 RepID=A0A5B7CL29_PORTR|nr:hypothetical protein [Portunus trituberculatus]